MTPATFDLKAWATLRALGCRAGVICCRTDPLDGPRLYFSIRFGAVRQHATMDALREYVEAQKEPA